MYSGCTNPVSSFSTGVDSSKYDEFKLYVNNILDDISAGDSDLTISDAGDTAIEINTAADIYKISQSDLLKYLVSADAPQILIDLLDGSAVVDGSVYYNSNQDIAMEILPEAIDSSETGVDVSDDGTMSFDEGDSLELPSNDLLNTSYGGSIEFTFKNTHTDDNGKIIKINNAFFFRKGRTYERMPYTFEIVDDKPVLTWNQEREDEAYAFQIFRNNLLFSIRLMDSTGKEHVITAKAKNISDIINSGKDIQIRVDWDEQVRIFLQKLDETTGEPVFDLDGNPVMVNVTSGLGISNLASKINGSWVDTISDFDGNGEAKDGETYKDYINYVDIRNNNLAELQDSNSDDVYVQIDSGVTYKTNNADIVIGGGFELENMTVGRNPASFDLFGEIKDFVVMSK
jgi:hypothetical protein